MDEVEVEITLESLQAQLTALTAAVDRLQPSTLVSVTTAAGRLGVSPLTVRRMAKAGKLPSKKIGRRVVVDLKGM